MTLRPILALSLALLGTTAQAGPLSWAKRQVREHPVRTRFATTLVAGAVYAEGLHRGRLGGVENTQCHYGAAWGCYGATMALDGVAQLVGYKLGGKTGDAISYGGNLGLIGWSAYQWHGGLNKPAEEKWNETHPDLSRVVLLRLRR